MDNWRNATCDFSSILWPQGVWLTLRKNDELVEILFLPWCSLERDCVNGTEIELPKTEEIWLQLFLSDEKLGLRGYASSERLINTNSTLNSCLDSYQGRDLTDQQTENALSLNSTTTPLTRTTMCDFLLEYPLIEHNAGKWQAAKSVEAVPPDPDTLIIYAFSHSDGWREDNLFYLLAIGLPSDPRYHFAVVVNGPLDPSWAALLDRVARRAGGAFEWLRRRDCGRDVCAWLSVLTGALALRQPLASFRRFLLLNGSARGPFVPAGFRVPWPELFFAMLDDSVGLAGVTVNCLCEWYGCRVEDAGRLHIQSYLLAFDRGAVLDVVTARMRAACAGMLSSDPRHVEMIKVGTFEGGRGGRCAAEGMEG